MTTVAATGVLPQWAPRAGRTVLPAAAVIVVQLVAFPMPTGVVLQGVIVGLLGALVAVGMGLVYRANHVVNFAQAQLGLAPTVLAASLVLYAGVEYFVAATVGLLAAVLVGAVVELAIIRRFSRSPRLILAVATIGLSELLAAAAFFVPAIWGQQATAAVVHVPLSIHFSVFPLVFSADHVAALVVAPIALGGVFVLLRRTSLGIAIRASAERADRAALLGIPVARLQTVVWILAAVLSFVGTFLQAGILGVPVSVSFSLTVLLASLAALVLGDLVDLPAIALAAVALGVLQQGVLWNHETDPTLVDAVLAVVVVAGLLVRRAPSSRAAIDRVSSWVVAEEVRPIPHELAHRPAVRAGRLAALTAVAAVVVALPWLLSSNAGNQLKATAVVVYALIAVSVVVVTGWSGQITLGQMAFVGIGGATGAYATQTWHLDLTLALLVGGAVAAAVAAAVSVPTLRMRGFFPAVTTLAFAAATTEYLLNPQYFSWVPVQRVARPELFGRFSLASQPAYYYFCLVVLLLVVLGLRGVRRSRTGRALLAVRDNELAAQAFGVNAARTKVIAFAVSGFVAGVSGCLLVHLLQAFSPEVFSPDQGILVFTTAVVGGLGSLLGAVLGALYLQGGQWFLPGADWQALVSAIGVLLVLMVVPGGLGDVAYRLRDGLLRRYATRRGLLVPSLVADRAPSSSVVPAAAVATDGRPAMTEADAERALAQEAG
jgi:branched-chain amino acid transport system permease protein